MKTRSTILQHRPSAFAAVTAIVLIGLVAATLAALGMMFAADARRTRSELSQTQIRQLLIAGAGDAKQRIEKGEIDFRDQALALPVGLGDQQAKVVISAVPDGEQLRATVTVDLATHHVDQTLRFENSGERWKLQEVR